MHPGDTQPQQVPWDPKISVILKALFAKQHWRHQKITAEYLHTQPAPHIPPPHIIATTARHQILPKGPPLKGGGRMLERHNPHDGWIDTIRKDLIHL